MKAPFAFAIVAAALLAPAQARVQAPAPKWGIYVDCSDTDDAPGKAFCSSLRDVIARSPRYTLLTTDPGTGTRYVLDVLNNPVAKGITAASVVYLLHDDTNLPIFMSHVVLTVNVNNAAASAAKIFADFDSNVDRMSKAPR
jgi:hypothetical protein